MLGRWLQIDSGYLANSSVPTGASTVRVNVIAASDPSTYVTDVVTKITSARSSLYPSKTLTITQNNSSTYTGSDLTTANYDCIFIWSNGAFSGSTLGNNINTFINSGGGCVIAVFASASVQIAGLNYALTPCVYPNNQSMASTSLGTYTSSDPLMLGVTTFNPGSSRFGAGGLTAQPGATVVANYNDNNILVAKKTQASGARTVTLNFFPPSSSMRSDFWNIATNGSQLMCNAIMWTGKAT